MAEYLGLDVHVALSGYLNCIATEPVNYYYSPAKYKTPIMIAYFFYNVVSLFARIFLRRQYSYSLVSLCPYL